MRDEIRQILHVEADNYLLQEQTRLQIVYENLAKAQVCEMIAHMTQQTEDFYLSLLAALDGDIPVAKLYETHEALKQVSPHNKFR